MKTVALVQGSPEWLAHRAIHFNASDAPAMMGKSQHSSRSELMHAIATGITPDIDPRTQKRFDDGHRFEALARPLAEAIIGDDLFPVVGVVGEYSASFDGLTMGEDVAFEHKTLNDTIRAWNSSDDITAPYRIQMEQQCMVSGCEKILFMASIWTDDCDLVEEKHFWYYPDLQLRAQIGAGWVQFKADLAAYVPVEVIPAAVATPTLDLPVVSIQTSGAVAIISNLRKFGESLNLFIAALPVKPSTDQEFADCKAALTKLKTSEETLDSEEARALSQMSEIDEMRREKKLYFDLARTTRLALEKLVTAREAAIKGEILQEGKDKLRTHIEGLNTRLARVQMPVVLADFAGAMKNKRTLASLRDAVDTALANAKIEASQIADKMQINLATLDQHGHAFLFADLAALCIKAPDDLLAVIKSRINDHEAAEQARIDADRERIRAEEQAKAVAEVAKAQPAPVAAPAVVEPVWTSPVREVAPIAKPSTIASKAQQLALLLESFTDEEIELILHYAENLVDRRQAA